MNQISRVYIAGPLSGEGEELLDNVRRAGKAAHALMDRGYYPFCPHLCSYLHLLESRPRSDWIAWGLEWVRQCDAVYQIGDSEGTRGEVMEARRLGIPVFRSIEDFE